MTHSTLPVKRITESVFAVFHRDSGDVVAVIHRIHSHLWMIDGSSHDAYPTLGAAVHALTGL